jgi:uncharacterized protein
LLLRPGLNIIKIEGILKDSAVEEKLQSLIDVLKGMDGAVLAYSGGVDSTFLLKALRLSGIKTLAVTSKSPTVPVQDMEDAKRMAREIGVEHRVIETSEMEDSNFVKNASDRCFHCKDELFNKLRKVAQEENLRFVLDGTTLDDASDHRPGMRAAELHGVRSPLLEAGFRKEDIREASRGLGLDTWEKPSSACLSSRIPYGTPITAEALRRIAEGEKALRALGFNALRVRAHGPVARIEVPEAQMPEVLKAKDTIADKLREAGFKFVCLDLEGLRSGSMNRLIDE